MTANNDRWWRNKCDNYGEKLEAWASDQPRQTKAVREILYARASLLQASKMHYDEQAYDTLVALDNYMALNEKTKRAQDIYMKICCLN
jgi:hypothetical protein